MFHFCVTAEALPLLLQNSIDATIWSEILQDGLTYTIQTWSRIYDAIRCEPSDVSGYLIRTSGCLIWHDLTTLLKMFIKSLHIIVAPFIFFNLMYEIHDNLDELGFYSCLKMIKSQR